MRTNLAEMNTIINDQIANENNTPTITDVESASRITGFLVPDPKKREEALMRRRQQVSQYDEACTRLETTLGQRNVKPLAIMPTKMWRSICEQSGLYRFQPLADGTVPVDTSVLGGFQLTSLLMGIILWAGIFVGQAVRIAHMMYYGHNSLTNIIITAILAIVTVIGYLIAANTTPNGFIVFDGWLTHQLTRLMNRWPHERIARRFFPNREPASIPTTPKNVHQVVPPPTYAKVVFPTPPSDVVETLLRVADMNLSVAVVPEAFRFAHPPSEILRNRIDERTQERIKMWDERADPIIYVEDGTVTAIVAQFGGFPVEREIVEKIAANPEYLI